MVEKLTKVGEIPERVQKYVFLFSAMFMLWEENRSLNVKVFIRLGCD